ncbi:MAG: hypothetical protein FWG38_05430, partial [Defluviitaleaceae bacterium]|nr:hypothetical protein [Defluviitaleaceae bacterium]
RENYDAMKRYIAYLERNTKNGLVLPGVGLLGDWLATETGTDNDLIFNAIATYIHRLMAHMAAAIGQKSDAEKFADRYEALRQVWTRTFICPTTGKARALDGSVNDTQCAYAMPLAFGLLSGEAKRQMAAHLNRKTMALDYTLTTGFLGTGAICQALSENGYTDTAYRLLLQTKYPSWLYSVTQGATTIWERWNSYTTHSGFGGNNSMNSFNHYSLGAVGAWLMGHALGIQPLHTGYRHILLTPRFWQGLPYARGYYHSPYGRIESGWAVKNGDILYEAVIPPNTQAVLRLPDGAGGEKEMRLCSGAHRFKLDSTHLHPFPLRL